MTGSNVRLLQFSCVCLTIIALFLVGCEAGHTVTASSYSEEARATSPNGQLDAVLIRTDGGGAAGGWEWYIFIVIKGRPVDISHSRSVFNAGTLTDCKLVWVHANLLEIHYDIASINEFRNIWALSEAEHGRNASSSDYFVEVKLTPTSEFSVLTSDGSFRSKHN